MSENDNKIRVGSRKSELALIQTRHVISLLKNLNPEKEFEIVTMNTLGDKVLNIPLPKIGEKSLFTKELETALTTKCVDFVVHSLKDLPTTLPPGMAIGAVLTREDPRDALVLNPNHTNYLLETLPPDSVIGTSSLRRTAQLAKKYPHLKVENIRGNLNTRLKKLDELGKYHGIILAAAGLIRMGWTSRINKILESEELLYAVGQGALAVECRADDEKIIQLLRPLYDAPTALRIIAERSFLKTLGGGCSAPVAISTDLTQDKENRYKLELKGAVWSLDGKEEIIDLDSCNVEIKKEDKRCASCPYNKLNETSTVVDIENIKKCTDCPNEIDIPAKRQKVDDTVPIEVLKNDPHEHCPVQIPIGADFMGKCPYLESNQSDLTGKCPVNGVIEEAVQPGKCPFMKDGVFVFKESDSNEIANIEDSLYCGLVPHEKILKKYLDTASNLGIKLAQNLMKRGASEVMAKAQAIVHGSIEGASTK